MIRIMKSIQVCFLHNAYVERLENGHIGGLEDTLMISINAQLLKPAADICAVMWHLYAAFCHLLFILHPPIISFITPVCSGHRRFCTCRGFVVLSWFNVIIQALRAQDNPARYIHRRHGQIVREWKVLRNSYEAEHIWCINNALTSCTSLICHSNVDWCRRIHWCFCGKETPQEGSRPAPHGTGLSDTERMRGTGEWLLEAGPVMMKTI